MNPKKRLLAGLTLIALTGAGCQTFTAESEDWGAKSWAGTADRRVGDAVATVGTAAYLGATVGTAIAGAVGGK